MKNLFKRLPGLAVIIAGLALMIPTGASLPQQLVISKANASGTGGPIVLDGMDPVCHAAMGENTDGYISKVVKSVYDRSNGPNDGSIAIIGAANLGVAGGCGGNWSTLLPEKFLTEFGTSASGLQPNVTFYTTDVEINAFFNTTISATAPRMIWFPDDWGRSGSVETILTTNAEKIADFVNSGGGLFSNFGSYGWLTALLPSAVFNNGGCNGGPEATTDGSADFGLTNTIVAACWHGYFTGDIGTLKVLVDYPYPSPTDTRKAVSIGGGSVSLPSSFMLAVSPTNPEAGQSLTITATAQTLAGVPQSGVVVSMTVSSGPDAGQTFTATTDSSGVATFTINTSSVGSNTYTASATVNGVLKTVSVTTTWSPPSSTTTAPTITSVPNIPTPNLPAPTPLYEVTLDMNGGSCIIDGVVNETTISAVFVGYRYVPGPAECSRDGYSLSGWSLNGATESANLPLLIDITDGVWRYFIASDMELTAVWSEHPVPTTQAPDEVAPPTTEHDHSTHDHGDGLPKTGSNLRLNWAIGLILIGAVILYIPSRKREVR
jgi:hypothetical protein